MPTPRYGYATLSHGKTRYLEAGSGPPLILIHGAGYLSGADNWWPVLPALSEHYRCIAPDCVNWGLSDPFDEDFSFAYLVDFIREFQDAMGLRKTHLAGHSMGGWLGSLLCYESPDRVDKYIDIAGGGMSTKPLRSMVEFQGLPAEEIRKQASALLKTSNLDPAGTIENYVAELSKPERIVPFGKVMKHMSDPKTRHRYHLTRRLPHVRAPSLIVGGRGDETNPIAMAEEKSRLIPHAKLLILECGHYIPREDPDGLTKAMIGFIG